MLIFFHSGGTQDPSQTFRFFAKVDERCVTRSNWKGNRYVFRLMAFSISCKNGLITQNFYDRIGLHFNTWVFLHSLFLKYKNPQDFY
jgi:hypothetical protein